MTLFHLGESRDGGVCEPEWPVICRLRGYRAARMANCRRAWASKNENFRRARVQDKDSSLGQCLRLLMKMA